MNHFDLNIEIRCMVCPGVIDLVLYYSYNHKDELQNIIIQEDKWDLYQKY